MTDHSDSGMAAFLALGLSQELAEAAVANGYSVPTPIQQTAIPPALAGKDVLGAAQTGTGKTAAFLWPILMKLAAGGRSREPRALILLPTRELAAQVYMSFLRYRGRLTLRPVLCAGGASIETQTQELQHGCDAVVATPGRLIELVLQNAVSLENVATVVLDEADRMLELGFYTDTRRLLRAVAPARQTMMFSATLISTIEEWAGSTLTDPVRVEAAPSGTLVESVRERLVRVKPRAKAAALLALLQELGTPRTLVFLNHRGAVDALSAWLVERGISAAALHGGRDQRKRDSALSRFRSGEVRVLVATDVAARGLDIPDTQVVVHGELAGDPLEYVHRSGRTARMGRDGLSVALVSDDDLPVWRDIVALTGRDVSPGEIAGFDPEGDHAAVLSAPSRRPKAQREASRKREAPAAKAAEKRPRKPKPAPGASEIGRAKAKQARRTDPTRGTGQFKVRRNSKKRG